MEGYQLGRGRRRMRERIQRLRGIIGRYKIDRGISILPKAIYRFNAIPVKISMAYFTDLEQISQKCI